MDKVTANHIAVEVARFELCIQHEDGEWYTDNDGNEVFAGTYYEEDKVRIERIAEYILKTFNDTDWEEISNNEKIL
jgi:hypothetical protein